jgi:hypothetical protein
MNVRWNWGTGIATVYAVFACGTMGIAGFAMSRPVDLVSADYYQRSLQEDHRIEAMANARDLGAGLRIEVTSDVLVVRFADAAAPRDGTLVLYRPSDAKADVRTPLRSDASVHAVPVRGLPRGLWIVKLEWSADGRPFYYEQPVMLP